MIQTIHIDPTNATPIWKQIEENVRHLVASEILLPGMPMPSVRDLSKELRVNPATVAKAYQRLTDAGVLMVKRGEGTFVSESPPVMPDEKRKDVLRDGARRYAAIAATIGATPEEAIDELKNAMAQTRLRQNEPDQEPEDPAWRKYGDHRNL